MYRPNKIMKAGTWADPDFNGADAYNADGRYGRHRHERTDAGMARRRRRWLSAARTTT